MNCIFMKWGECTNEELSDEESTGSCENCPQMKEADDFAAYLDWIKGEDMKLRKEKIC